MFKGILPSKRATLTDFTVLTALVDVPTGKENVPYGALAPANTKRGPTSLINPKKKRSESKKPKEDTMDLPETNVAFDKLLDDLQIPPSLRPKLMGMDSTVKAEMIKSAQVLVLNPPAGPAPAPPATPPRTPGLRRVHSTESLASPRAAFMTDLEYNTPPKSAGTNNSYVSAHNSPYAAARSRQASGHSRGASLFFSRSQGNLASNQASSSNLDLTALGKPLKDKGVTIKNLSPMRFCSMLQGQSSLHIDVEDIKKLRLMLRNESANWTEEFCTLGGYSALLTRLNEVLEVEWREEQHDDKVLHELLRCFKALSTSSIGCFALRSSCPTPWVQLVSLLYSDKKPGEVATRQLIVDLFMVLFQLYPASALPSHSRQPSALAGQSRSHREAWESPSQIPTSNVIKLPQPHQSFFSFIRSLLLTPAPPPTEAPGVPVSPHEFIESLHVPRIYKSYLQEMSDVCRDYFWVFCHPNNTIWVLLETDENRVEKPKAPSGMTGGVEFEAIGYFTTHLRFINSVACSAEELNMPKEHELSAYRFHCDLFLSGLERILLISRKASTTYYPTLHLEISRYINHAIRAGYELPYTVSRLIGTPPATLLKNPSAQGPSVPNRANAGSRLSQLPTTHTKRMNLGHPPQLPSPRKVDAIKFD